MEICLVHESISTGMYESVWFEIYFLISLEGKVPQSRQRVRQFYICGLSLYIGMANISCRCHTWDCLLDVCLRWRVGILFAGTTEMQKISQAILPNSHWSHPYNSKVMWTLTGLNPSYNGATFAPVSVVHTQASESNITHGRLWTQLIRLPHHCLGAEGRVVGIYMLALLWTWGHMRCIWSLPNCWPSPYLSSIRSSVLRWNQRDPPGTMVITTVSYLICSG